MTTLRRGRLLAEFILIDVGVLAALAVDDWRESQADRASEEHLLQGIRADLERDLGDLWGGINGAQSRMAGADELLRRIGDPDAGVVRIPPFDVGQQARPWVMNDFEEELAQARAVYPTHSVTAQQALLMATLMLRFDIAGGTYQEATASG